MLQQTEIRLIGGYWLVSADMGYGHQRAIYPLEHLARGGTILNANLSRLATPAEKRLWSQMLGLYEFMSRAGNLPLVGTSIKRALDGLLHIPKPYATKKRHQRPTLQVRYLYRSIRKGLCRGIVEEISSPPLPLITSFYSSAMAAHEAGHPGVYCIICDTDVNRVWVAEHPRQSSIIYFAPCSSAARRLMDFGVPRENIQITGFPLPLQLLGNRDLDTLRRNLRDRLRRLDPRHRFSQFYSSVQDKYLGTHEPDQPASPVTITFCVGGAGAQKEIGRQLAISLRKKILAGRIALNLVAGTRAEVRDYFQHTVDTILEGNPFAHVIYAPSNAEYFALFNDALHTTDVLWTKPSELSFYCALGIPIVMTPVIGPQEKCNKRWLTEIGAGIKQHDPRHASKWFTEMLKKGRFAEAALNGFMKARKYGTYHIMDYLATGDFEKSLDPRWR